MSTSNYQTEKAKKHTKAVLLLEIDIVGDGNNSRTLYLSDKYLTIESTNYEGIVQSWGGMDVTIYNEGLSAISDYSIILANDRLNYMTTDTCISDIFDSYYWAGSVCRVYQWFEDLTLKSDAELIFKGMVKQPSFDLNEVRFDIQESNSIHQNVPLDIVTLNNYSEAPEESIDNPLPMVFGNDWAWTNTLSDKAAVSPCIETDSNLKTFYIASHKVEAGAVANKMLIYLEEVKSYGFITAANATYTNDSDGSRFSMLDTVSYTIYMVPKIKGSEYTSAVTDYSNATDQNAATVISLAAGEKYYLKFGSFMSKGFINGAITLKIGVENVAGTDPYAELNVYNEDYDDGTGGNSTGQNITGNGAFEHDIKNSKAGVHGSDPDQDDVNMPWTMNELANLEYGLTIGAGDSLDLQYMYLVVDQVSLTYSKPVLGATRRPRP